VALSLAVAPTALAQGQTAPGTIEREYEDKTKPPRTVEKDVRVPALETQGPPANADQVRFVLSGVDIDGNTVLSDEQLGRPFASLIGQEVSLAQMFAAANEITRMYVQAGYALCLAFVPAQEVKGGIVRIRVIEGYIGEVEFRDERTFHSKLWGGFADRLQASRPLKTEDLERYLLLANDLAGVEVLSTFERMDGDAGATRLVMDIRRKWIDARLEANNRGSEAIGPVRVQLNAATNNLLGAEERFSLFGVRVPDGEELAYFAGRFDLPLTSDGLSMAFDLGKSHSKVGADLALIDFQTDGWTGALGFTYPIIRSRAQNLFVSLGVSYKNLKSSNFFFPENTHDIMTVIVATGDYDTYDRWGGLLQATGTLHVGLDVFDATQSNDPLASRAGASGEFIRLEATVSRLQSLRSYLHLYGELGAQVADGSLLVSEQCGYGGAHLGRGFDPFEIAGDHCIKGMAELRYDLPLEKWRLARFLDSAQAYGLADFGWVIKSGDLVIGEERSQAGASLGLGVRVRALEYLSGLVEVAQPVGLGVEFENDSKDPRVFFGVALEY
jgi:hemolysin activation/secretion protein